VQPVHGEIQVVPDVPEAFATLVAGELRGVAPGRIFRLALSGGPTAGRCYAQLAGVAGLPWERVEVFWGDERCVPPDDPDSNARLGREALLDHVGPLAGVHPMSCEDGPTAYETLLKAGGPLDLVHLGLGPDGHTASLFPGSDPLEKPDGAWVSLNRDPGEHNPHDRMTVTMTVLDAARLAVFTVSGAEKAAAFARVRAGEDLPGGRVAAGRVLWLVDPAAAGA
jgi:6-phosphogluconolactonase